MTELRLLLVTDAVGGVWTYSLELARALKPVGVETVLAVTGPSPNREQREAASGLELIDTWLPLEWLVNEPAAMARAGKELARIAEIERVDIVQTSSAALAADADFDVPFIAVQHSCVATWWAAVKGSPLPEDFRWRTDMVARGLRKAAAVVAPSRAFAAATQRAYRVDATVLTVPNGRTPRDVRPLPQGDFVLAAGRLWDEGKNVATLDAAAAQIEAPFQAAGSADGPNATSVQLNSLVPLGQLSEARLGGLIAARPIFASAALYEPFGLAPLEAAQAGCALVLSDIDTHRELWEGAAIFVEARDSGGFASAINALLTDREQRNELGERAREHARRYTPEAMARGMAAIYAQVTVRQPAMAGAA